MQQVLALVAYVAATALCFWVEARRELQASVAVAAAIVLFCFLHVSLVDPAQDATGLEKRCVAAFYPFRPEASRSHYLNRASYCAQCRKCVWGLDHHCPWLNTCIGRRNYPTFFALGVFGRAVVKSGSRRRRDVGLSEDCLPTQVVGALQFATATAAGVVVVVDAPGDVPAWVLAGLSLILFGSLAALVGFHALLILRNEGTFDALLRSRDADPCDGVQCAARARVAPDRDDLHT